MTLCIFYGCRYYSPATGRWPSRDPIGERGALVLRDRKAHLEFKDSPPFGEEESGGEPDPLNEANVYLFVGNSPIDLVDPIGLAPFCVCIRCGSDHCWIHVKDKATGVIHSYGRWKIGYGTPPTTSSGVNVDRELTRTFEASRCLQVDSFTPTINAGYEVTHNNCATYARDEWSRVFGEGLYAGIIYHDPATLRDSIKSKNGGAPRAYRCCFPWAP
jgi:hypothetical protein